MRSKTKGSKARRRFRHPDWWDAEMCALVDDIRDAPTLRADHLDAAYAMAGLPVDGGSPVRRNPALRKRMKLSYAEVATFVKRVLPAAEIVTYGPPVHAVDLKHEDRFKHLDAPIGEVVSEPDWIDFKAMHQSCSLAAMLLAALQGRRSWMQPGAR